MDDRSGAPDGLRYGFQSPEAEAFPSIIVLENTNVCNLRCIHCPQGQGWADKPSYRPEYLEWDLYKKAIDEIARHRISVLRMSPAGEALIHPQFLDQVAYAKEKGISPVDLTTNGLTLDNPAVERGARLEGKTILDRLLELGLDIVDISLDAFTRATYERIRVGSDYNRVVSNVHRLLYLREKRKAPTKVMVSFIDQPESRGELDAFREYWEPLVDRVLVRPYLDCLGLTPKKGTMEAGGVRRWPCPQFWKRVTINSEGKVRFCVVDSDDRSVVGDLRTDSIESIWKSPEYRRLREAHLAGRFGEAHPICGACTDWMGSRWDWGFEVAVDAVLAEKKGPGSPETRR